MKLFSILFQLALIAFALLSCSESTEPDNNATINIYSAQENSSISTIKVNKNNHSQANTIDSLKVTKVKILISSMKIHLYQNTDDENQLVKVGPLAFIGDVNPYFITKAVIPIGTYNKIKFELHRFEASQLQNYVNDTLFSDFATNERYSVIITGSYFSGAVENKFTYNGTVTANVTIDFSSNVTVQNNLTFSIVFDAEKVFKSGNVILDPTDSKNQNDIDNAIKEAFKYELFYPLD